MLLLRAINTGAPRNLTVVTITKEKKNHFGSEVP